MLQLLPLLLYIGNCRLCNLVNELCCPPPCACPPLHAGCCHAFREVTHQCRPGCTSRGNCNAELGTCECPFGYTGKCSVLNPASEQYLGLSLAITTPRKTHHALTSGPSCEKSLLDACRSGSNGSMPFINWAHPKSCACLMQIREFENGQGSSGALGYSWKDIRVCYDRSGSIFSDPPLLLPPSPPPDNSTTVLGQQSSHGVTWKTWRQVAFDTTTEDHQDLFTSADAPSADALYTDIRPMSSCKAR